MDYINLRKYIFFIYFDQIGNLDVRVTTLKMDQTRQLQEEIKKRHD